MFFFEAFYIWDRIFPAGKKTLHPQPLLQASPLQERKQTVWRRWWPNRSRRIKRCDAEKRPLSRWRFAAYEAATGCCVFRNGSSHGGSHPRNHELWRFIFSTGSLEPDTSIHLYQRLFLNWMIFFNLYREKVVGNHYFHPLKSGSKWSFQVHICLNDLVLEATFHATSCIIPSFEDVTDATNATVET